MSTEVDLSRPAPDSTLTDATPVPGGMPAPSAPEFARQLDKTETFDKLVPPGPDDSSVPVDEAFSGKKGKRAKKAKSRAAKPSSSKGLTPQKSVSIFLTLFIVFLVGALSVLGSYLSASDRIAKMTALVGDGVSHSQQTYTAVAAAMQGSSAAFETMSESRQRLESVVSELGEAQQAGKVPANVAPLIAELKARWDVIDPEIVRVIDSKDLLVKASEARSSVLSASTSMLASAQAIVDQKLKRRRPSAKAVAQAGELAIQTQRIAKEAALRLSPQSAQFGQAGDLLATLAAFDPKLVEIAGKSSQVIRFSDQIRVQLSGFAPVLEEVLGKGVKLQRAAGARRAIDAGAGVLQEDFVIAQSSLETTREGKAWMPLVAAGLGLFSLFCALALSRAYIRLTNARTEEAQRQKEVAEKLQAEAKQTNDQNQAAILRLMNELQEVADGDLTVQATVSEDITGAIADSVNYTVEELRSLVSRINLTAEMVNKASSSAHVAVSQLQEVSEQQSREMKKTGESVLNMAKRIDDVSKQASKSVEVARQSLSASQEGSRAVKHSISGMNLIRDQIQETSKRIKRLGESSQEIGEIVELISDLTEQTNVLALNAAIQAASAGEAGRGFTIVAEEVQRLAERSAEATKQISGLIKTIQTDTHDAVAAMERSTQGVVDGTRRSDEAGNALEQIGSVSSQLAELIEDIGETTHNQADSAGVVANSIQNIFQVTKQTADGTAQTAESVQQLSTLSEELKNSVSRFKVA